MLVRICLLLAFAANGLGYKSYSGYQILRTSVLKKDDIQKLLPLIETTDIDFWSTPRIGGSAEILVSPEKASDFRKTLENLGLNPKILFENVEKILEAERGRVAQAKLSRSGLNERFCEFEEIMHYIDNVVSTYPEIASVMNIGTSWEGRPLRVLKLSNGPGKNGIFFDSAMHAREWIGPPTLMYAIAQLTENLDKNQALLDANDWYFLLVANPDGYVYTWTDDRFWRKNRKPNLASNCTGTDLNRNFDQHWDKADSDECSNLYRGDQPFSEPEAKAVADFLLEAKNITLYVAVHSFGQYILLPWAHTTELPANFKELEAVAIEANKALSAVNGTEYSFGATASLLYYAYGISQDWAYAKAGIPLSFTMELRPGEKIFDPVHFEVDAATIPSINAECWEAYKVFASHTPQARGDFEDKPDTNFLQLEAN